MRRSALFVLLALTVLGQEAPPAFEVASVKPAVRSDMGVGLFSYPGGRIVATQCTLKLLIFYAYDVETYRIVGGPSWSDVDWFEIEAKPPATSPSSKWAPANSKTPPNPEMRLMLRSLLADRFGLKVHWESRKESVYRLVAGKDGHKLKAPDGTKSPFVGLYRNGDIHAAATSYAVVGTNATMDQLAKFLAGLFHRPVKNETGIEGNFDFEIPYGEEGQTDDKPDLILAIQKQAGLKLEPTPGSVDVLVIDHAEKPTAN